MNKFLLLIIGTFFFVQVKSQTIERQVFGSFGASGQVNDTEICFTAGEPITQTITSFSFILTQGFHQPIIFSEEALNFYFPNSFNPNSGIDVNTTFKPIYQENVTAYFFAVYSRWRVKIFETTNIDQGWDGTYEGEMVPSGVYVYTARFSIEKNGQTNSYTASGTIHMMR